MHGKIGKKVKKSHKFWNGSKSVKQLRMSEMDDYII